MFPLALPVLLALQHAAPPAPAPAAPTWSDGVGALIHTRCTECHRPGGGAPFALATHRDAARKSRTILEVVEDRIMPPWPAAHGGELYRDARRLSDAEIALIRSWVEAGSPEGDPARAPTPPLFSGEWSLGQPDREVAMAKPFTVPASGRDIYQYFTIPIGLESDRWLSAIDIRSNAPAVVHHVLFFVESPEAKATKRSRIERRRPIGGWAVGMRGQRLPLGLGHPIPAGSDLVLQVHFHPSGKQEDVTVRVGLWFTEGKPERDLLEFQLPAAFGQHAGIDIPAGDAAWTLRDRFRIPAPIEIVSVWAHAHTLCSSARAVAHLPDGTSRTLLTIPRWKFDWQLRYDFIDAVRLPAGTVIESELVYDNSANNPWNPFQPPQRIRWGEETTDEMGSLIFNAVAVDPRDRAALGTAYNAHVEATSQGVAGRGAERHIEASKGFDRDGDGILSEAEMPERWRNELLTFDRNRDGRVSFDELTDGLHGR
jgi:mono/diheme cytochrome c family protein